MHSHPKLHPTLLHAIKRLEQINPDQFEIYFQRTQTLRVDSRDQMIDSLSHAEDAGISIRLLKDQKMGFSFTTSLEPQSVLKAIDQAYEIANFMPEDPYNRLHCFENFVYPHVDHFDTQEIKLPVEHKIELAKTLERLCRKTDPRIRAVRSASVSETQSLIQIIDSSGEHIEYESTGYTASVSCKAESQGDQQMGSEFAFSPYLDSLPIEAIAHYAAHSALELLGAQSAPTLKCPAILRNSVVTELLEFLSSSFCNDTVDPFFGHFKFSLNLLIKI